MAVVAVHGVGTPAAGATAHALANLLVTHGFEGFVERPMSFFVAPPTRLMERARGGATKPKPRSIRQALEESASSSPKMKLGDRVGLAHLACYEPPPRARIHVTTRLQGRAPKSKRRVDVHEAYWADLTKDAAPTLVTFLRRVISFPSNVLRLACRTLEHASLAPGTGSWRSMHRLLAAFAWLLTVAVPVLVLGALAFEAVNIGERLPASARSTLAVVVPAVAAFVLTASAVFLSRATSSLTAVVPLGVAALVAYGTHRYTGGGTGERPTLAVLSIELVVAVAVAGLAVVGSLERTRSLRGAIVAVAVVGLVACGLQGPKEGFATAGTVTSALLVVTWGGVHLLALGLAVGLFLKLLAAGRGREARSVRRAVATAAGGAAFTLAAMEMLYGLSRQAMTARAFRAFVHAGESEPPLRVLFTQTTHFLVYGAPLVTVLVAAPAAALLAYALAPSLFCELAESVDDKHSRPLGVWLSRGFGLLWVLLVIGALGIVAAPPLMFWAFDFRGTGADAAIALGNRLWAALGLGALAVLGGLLRAPASFKSAWPFFAVVFDIDAHLAEHPASATARARVVERFSATLRQLRAWRDEDGRGYARIILVCHSQGTVVVCDALRLLRFAPPHDLGDVRLFTFGSPLRQLYARALPHLYGWVDGDAKGPRPADHCVTRWTNAFRSGDYIGRDLWMANDDARFDAAHTLERSGVKDVCLGAGAHLGYWRDPAVAELIAQAIEEPDVSEETR